MAGFAGLWACVVLIKSQRLRPLKLSLILGAMLGVFSYEQRRMKHGHGRFAPVSVVRIFRLGYMSYTSPMALNVGSGYKPDGVAGGQTHLSLRWGQGLLLSAW
jgi:hypothetical protein